MPRSRIVQNERTHYVLVNSEHYIRTLVLEDQQYVSLNSTSLAVKVRPSDEKLAKVYFSVRGEKEEGYGHYQHASELQIYDKRRVQFGENPGTVYIESTADGYFNRVLADVSQTIVSKDSAGPN